jgi:AbrB family looped-hinge helix DNA binding protein
MTELHKKKHIFGTVKVGDRGQIVIPKEARDLFGIGPGDLLMVLGEEGRGIAIVKADFMKKMALKILDKMGSADEEPEEGTE